MSRLQEVTKAAPGSVSPGGPRPSTLSSQRRLLNSSTLNRTVKDSRIPKPTTVKAKSSSVSTISKNTAVGTKVSKLNRNLPPDSYCRQNCRTEKRVFIDSREET